MTSLVTKQQLEDGAAYFFGLGAGLTWLASKRQMRRTMREWALSWRKSRKGSKAARQRLEVAKFYRDQSL